MAKKEFKVGEIFQCGLVKLKVVKQEKIGTCTGCVTWLGWNIAQLYKNLLVVVTMLKEKTKLM